MIQVCAVRVEDRHRSDLGDLEGLAESLRELGQLQPIVVTSDLRLIAGGRRLAAARLLGWSEIEAKIAHDLTDAASLLRAERDENTCRKAFVPSEEYSLYEALLAFENDQQDERNATNEGQTGGADATRVRSVGFHERQSAAMIVSGRSGRHRTLEKVGEVKRIAEDPTQSDRLRQKARDALAEMDRTGNIAGPHTGVMLAARAEEARDSGDMSSWSEDEVSRLEELRAGRTVVVSFRENHANLVRWAQAEGHLVSVDRRTEWGNPFEMPYDGDREVVIRNYAEYYLPHKPSLLSRVGELRGKALGCWCAPEHCHADVLKLRADALGSAHGLVGH
jgi:ParB family transcriptional regulator, chromosome partitioning protein